MKKLCEQCGKEFTTFPTFIRKGQGRFCSLKCKGKASRSAKSIGEYDGFNVYVGTNGYARIVFGRSNEKLFHVYLMEKVMGRELIKNERVHHINGDKLDNRIDNLQLVDNCGGHQKEHADIRIKALGGMPGVHKYCPSCDTLKTLEEFPKAKDSYQGRHGFCKICSCNRVNAYRKANKDAVNARKRERYALRKAKQA